APSSLWLLLYSLRSHRVLHSFPTRRSSDLKVTLKLDLAEVASGTTKKIKVRTYERCAECSGSGAARGSRPTSCGTCGGSGEVRRDRKEHTSELQSLAYLVCRLLLEKKNKKH